MLGAKRMRLLKQSSLDLREELSGSACETVRGCPLFGTGVSTNERCLPVVQLALAQFEAERDAP